MNTLRNPEFWVLVSAIIFFVLFGRKLWSGVTILLDGRTNTVRAQLEEASRLRAEAETMLRNAQRERDTALQEARDIVARSREEAARVGADARRDAETAAKRRERQALDRIAAAEKAVVAEIRQTAADLAAQAARDVIAHSLTAQDDAALVDEAIGGLPRALRAA